MKRTYSKEVIPKDDDSLLSLTLSTRSTAGSSSPASSSPLSPITASPAPSQSPLLPHQEWHFAFPPTTIQPLYSQAPISPPPTVFYISPPPNPSPDPSPLPPPPSHQEPTNDFPQPLSRPTRTRKSPLSSLGQGKSETIVAPYPWATTSRASIQTLEYLLSNGMVRISGQVQCKRCERQFQMEYNLREKYMEIATYIWQNKSLMNHRAPEVWMNPVLADCRLKFKISIRKE
ncbi:hypothetical protein RJ641_028291 [Dillenia turbinata]|uniref:DUF7086 domain-containing protein n=1 Tax=Dillenia turbinata TaxID=194707 RepID=A0AAN8ZIW1_9MAGN